MAVIVTANSAKVVREGNALTAYCKLTPSGTYGVPDTLDLSAIAGLGTDVAPDVGWLQSVAAAPSGYFYTYIPGTTLANGTFRVGQCAGSAAPAGDIGAGAYPAGVLADTIFAEFRFTNFGK